MMSFVVLWVNIDLPEGLGFLRELRQESLYLKYLGNLQFSTRTSYSDTEIAP